MITKKYYKLVNVSYEDEGYFYIRNISDQTGLFSVTKVGSGGSWNNVEYSIDGVNWISYDLTTLPTIQLAPNTNLYLRGNDSTGFYVGNRYYSLGLDTDFMIGGNIYSLVDKAGFKTRTESYGVCEFYYLFSNQTHLISAEKLNFGQVTSLKERSYQGMFYGCTSLTTPPEILPAITLSATCYYYMFYGCTSLTKTPELPATTLANSSYGSMFYGCTSLNTVKCRAEDISASNCTYDWLQNVAATGTFYKSANMSGWTTGKNGIPSGWTVVDA